MQTEIIDLELNTSIYQLTITFTVGAKLFIRYNEFNEYGYQLIITRKKHDIIRFDNFDDHWLVSSKPHHFHPKNNKPVRNSPMVGQPAQDIQKLIELIKIELF